MATTRKEWILSSASGLYWNMEEWAHFCWAESVDPACKSQARENRYGEDWKRVSEEEKCNLPNYTWTHTPPTVSVPLPVVCKLPVALLFSSHQAQKPLCWEVVKESPLGRLCIWIIQWKILPLLCLSLRAACSTVSLLCCRISSWAVRSASSLGIAMKCWNTGTP